MVLMLLIHVENMHGLLIERFHCDDQNNKKKKMRFLCLLGFEPGMA